jgi:hypothetical protein
MVLFWNLKRGRKRMIRVVDEYKLNLYCTCVGCRHCKTRNDASKYCVAHPEKLPPKIWNAKNAECPYFEERE